MNSYKRIPADPAKFFEPAEVEKAKTYQRPLTVARALSLALNLGAIAAAIMTRAAGRLVDALDVGSWPLQLIVIIAAFTVAFTIIDIPIGIWTTFKHEKKWEFSTQTPRGFVADIFKGIGLGLVLEIPLFLAFWWLIRHTDLWWIYAWAVFFGFSGLLAFLYPVLIAPIFNKFKPLEDESLVARLRGLAEGVGMRVKSFEVMDASRRTRHDNAYFAGFGKSRQVVVYDNLLESYSHGEIASVVAHELGHYRRRHVPKGLLLAAITSIGLFGVLRLVSTWQPALDWAGVGGFGQPAAFPLFILFFVATSSFIGVVASWFSRAHERQADIDSLEITEGDYDSFVAMMRKLYTKNLADLAPSWWKYFRLSHPPAAERLQLGDNWRADHPAPAKTTPTRTVAAQKRKPAPAKAKAKPKSKAKAKPKAKAKAAPRKKGTARR